MPPCFPQNRFPRKMRRAFTLIELLVVMGIFILLMGLVIPAVSSLTRSGDVTKAAYDISGTLETARAYAKANNTYVWVGFFEENEALLPPSPAVAGKGRVTLSVVASRDGTPIYTSTLAPLDPSRLIQVGKLIHIDNAHLAVFPDGTGTAANFSGRPAVNDTTAAPARIGEGSPSTDSQTKFQYPTGAAGLTAQYTFVKAIEFSPRGEARLNNANSGFKPVIEIGLQPTHGTVVDTTNNNPVAIQITGIVGSVTIYRK